MAKKPVETPDIPAPDAPDFEAFPAEFPDAVDDRVLVSKADLTQMIADAVSAAQSNQPNFAQMGEAIGAAVSVGMAKATRKRKSYGEYIRTPHSTTHPDPAFPNGPVLRRETLINGWRAQTDMLHDREIDLLNRLTHSGRYLNRLVEVLVQLNGPEEDVQIRWNTKTTDQRFDAARHWTDLEAMLDKIVTVQVEEDAEEALLKDEKQARRRISFDSKTTRDARAQAGV